MNKKTYIKVFEEIFEVEEGMLNEEFTFEKIDKWDSLTHLSLITAIEDAFGVMFDTDDILNFVGFINGMKILEKYGLIFRSNNESR